MKIELNDANLFLYAAKNYYSPLGIDAEEFNEDLNRFKSVSYTHLTLPTIVGV